VVFQRRIFLNILPPILHKKG